MNRWALNISALGFPTPYDRPFPRLYHSSGDMLDKYPSGNNNMLKTVPWSTSGIADFTSRFNSYWSHLKNGLTAISGSGFDFFAVDTEQFGNDVFGINPPGGSYDGSGWVTRCLADPRASSTGFTINGTQTFSQYWAATTGWYDGTPIPTGTQGNSFNTSPENQYLVHKWQAARVMNFLWATKKAIEEPMQTQFPGIYVNMYDPGTGGGNLEYPNDADYPGIENCLIQDTYIGAHGPDYYGGFRQYFDSNPALSEDTSGPPYWVTTTGWVLYYPKPQGILSQIDNQTSSGFTAFDYAAYRYGVNRMTQHQLAFPDNNSTPWLAQYTCNTGVMIEALKQCYSIGMRQFILFGEEGKFNPASSGNYDFWTTVVSALNLYVDDLNSTIEPSGDSGGDGSGIALLINPYRLATIFKVPAGFWKF